MRVLGWALAIALIGAALWYLRDQLPEIRRVASTLQPRWSLVAASAVIMAAAYAVLIEGWRRTLGLLGGHLSPARAAVIWLGSNLARYLPGSGWALGAMAVMAKRNAVPVGISAGSSVMIQVVNLVTGIGVFVAASAAAPALAGRGRWMILAGVVALAIAPFVLPHLERLVLRVTGRTIVMPRFGVKPVLLTALFTTLAWAMYGVAFWVLAAGVLPGPPPSLAGCVAVYVGSYIAGQLALVPPAGVGVMEYAMLHLSTAMGVFPPAEAALLAVVVRVARTILEIVPGVVALALATIADRRRTRFSVDDAAPR
ncbi:MAG: putative rane protein [Gemmatimonadetes bacterium]|jgi:hypothetical protein|nr:putative rane protein [Gemmatimonadota bacterium]